MNSEVMNMIVKGVITIAVALITGFVIPFIKSKIGTEKYSQIATWVNTFVRCAEQIFITASGEEKLAKVTEWTETKLKELGITLSATDIRALIEDAVQEMNEIKTYDIIDDSDIEYINCLHDGCEEDDDEDEILDV